MRKSNKNTFSLPKMLSAFYSIPQDQLEITHFEDILEAMIMTLKDQPEVLTPELLRFFYRYVSYKHDYSMLEILNLIGGH